MMKLYKSIIDNGKDGSPVYLTILDSEINNMELVQDKGYCPLIFHAINKKGFVQEFTSIDYVIIEELMEDIYVFGCRVVSDTTDAKDLSDITDVFF